MRVVIDTSSLLALVRYYLPFDKNGKLKKFIEKKFNSGELVVLDKVYVEAKRNSKGVIVKELQFLDDKSKHVKTAEILPDKQFFNRLENELCYGFQKNRLNEIEFESRKNEFLESADAKLVLYCYTDKNPLELDKPILVTEETRADNDNKLFKKLPEICTILEIDHCNLPALFKEHFKIELGDLLR